MRPGIRDSASRRPYIPGALPPLDPPAILAQPADHFAHGDLEQSDLWPAVKAASRHIETLAARASLAIAAIGVVTVLASALR